MTRQKLSLLIGFPLFGISILFVPELLDLYPPAISFFINIVPVTIGYIYHTSPLHLPYDVVIQNYIDEVIHLSFFIIFWLPVGFLANFCLEKYKTHRKNQMNND